MCSSTKKEPVDPILEDLIKNMDQLGQVQYSTRDQLSYLHQISIKCGLYDAANVINNLLTLPPTI